MKTIKLSQGKVALVDDEDYERLSTFKWHVAKVGPSYIYAVRTARDSGGSHSEFMHRVVLAPKPGEVVDHINHNGLDNRKENLRVCTQSQNCANKRKRVVSVNRKTSQYKGVTQRGSRWRAAIETNDKPIFLGSFKDEKAAALAYDASARKIFGPFALTNFPETRALE